ncbi:hypothetical protein LQZ18_02435 [Lachnospiraceae bacterium ZAX-1]
MDTWTFSDCKNGISLNNQDTIWENTHMKKELIQEFCRVLEMLTETQLVKMLAFLKEYYDLEAD